MNTHIDDAEFDNLTAALRDEFAGLTYDATLHLPARTSALVKGGAVVLAAGLAATVVYNRSDERAAWAAKPTPVSKADTATIEKLCADNFISADGPVRVRKLPPLVSVDARGERVLAVFGDNPAPVDSVHVFSECVLHWENGQLVLDPNPAVALVKPTESDSHGLAVDLASIVQLSPTEDKIMFAMGSVGSDVTRVALSGEGGPTAEASVDGGRYSIWWPNSTYTGPMTLTAYRTDGTSVTTLELANFSEVRFCLPGDHGPAISTPTQVEIPLDGCN